VTILLARIPVNNGFLVHWPVEMVFGFALLLIGIKPGQLILDVIHRRDAWITVAISFVAVLISVSSASDLSRCALKGLGHFGIANAL